MRFRKMFVGLLATMAGSGCGRSGGVAIPVGGTRLQFSHDETRLYLYGGGASISAWDIPGKRLLWERHFAFGTWMTLSASGEKVGVISQVAPGQDVHFIVLRAADGATLEDNVVPPQWQHSYETDERGFVGLAFDGSWAALSTGGAEEPEALSLAPLPNGNYVRFSEPANAVDKLAFDPRALRLAVSWRGSPHWLDLYENKVGTWQRVKRWEEAYCPAWTDRGLSFVTQEGFHITDGAADNLVLAASATAESLRESCETWRFSPDGAWLLRWSGWKLEVVSTKSGATIMTHAWEQRSASELCSTAFAGTRMRVFTCSGLLLEFDLAKAVLTKTEDFGDPWISSKAVFAEGASKIAKYRPTLSPSGDWIFIRKGRNSEDVSPVAGRGEQASSGSLSFVLRSEPAPPHLAHPNRTYPP